jgi:hypothetical protein
MGKLLAMARKGWQAMALRRSSGNLRDPCFEQDKTDSGAVLDVLGKDRVVIYW